LGQQITDASVIGLSSSQPSPCTPVLWGGGSVHNYLLYDVGHAALRPWRAMAEAAKLCFGNPFNPVAHTTLGRGVTAACELFERTTRRYDKPAFGLSSTLVDGVPVRVSEEVVWARRAHA
jgi:poly-beta-hydroxyalkanoate depolymerase